MEDKYFASVTVGGGKRLAYNDLAKSFGMLMIMWGHIRLTGWSNEFVYAFHIPLFFALSGMVFNKDRYDGFGSFLKKKVKSLLVPYVIFSFLTWIVWAVFAYVSHQDVESYLMPLAETFIARGSGGYLIHNVPLWFVSCLFIMEIIYYFIADLKRIWITIITILMATASYCAITYFKSVDFTAIPWNIETAFLGIPFYAAGHWAVCKWGHQGMVDFVNRHKALSWTSVVIFAAIVVIGSHINGSISFGHDQLHNVFLTYGCAFLGVAMTLILCMMLGEIKGAGKIIQPLIAFGRNSFTAMAIHNPIKGIMCVIVGAAFHCGSSTISNYDSFSFIAFIGTLIVTIIGILSVNWFKKFFSKKK